ncbi:response regulator [Bdellovibrio sp. KM01]|uniref:response regulator n=1 Tax=Bdellovibrio sp. KM01 TaxID=2748865 RepID=UPI0015E99D48|nr:response regulator [Bdellovibrio sp. KM01]QLY24451.1 response regulator [Bdellovibrio sp. KM01]
MKNLTALIVDSSPSYTNLIASALLEIGLLNENIFTTKRYVGALEFLTDKKPQLLITEFQVDAKFGLELVTMHTANSPNNISIIMTHNNSSSSIAEAAEELVDDYIVKPFQSGMLANRLRQLIDRKLNPSDYIKAIREGKQALLDGQLKDAEHKFSAALQHQEKPTLAHYYLGYTKFKETEYQFATDEFAKGLTLQPLHYRCLTGKFDTFYEQKDFGNAYTVANTIIENYPIGPKRLGQLFISAVFSGKLDEVPHYFQLFAQLDHKTPELRHVFSAALFTAGRSNLNNKALTKAVECFELGVQVLGADSEYISKIVKVLLRGDAQAVSQAARFLQQFPSSKVGSKEYENLYFLFNCKTLPLSKVIDQGRKMAAQNRMDAESYETFIRLLISDNKTVLAEDISERYQRAFPNQPPSREKA